MRKRVSFGSWWFWFFLATGGVAVYSKVSGDIWGFNHDWGATLFAPKRLQDILSYHSLATVDGVKHFASFSLLEFLAWPLGLLGVAATNNLYLWLVVWLAGYGSFRLHKCLGLSREVSILGMLLYVFSAVIVDRILLAYQFYLFSIALWPLWLETMILLAKERPISRFKYWASIILLPLLFTQIQFGIIGIICLIILIILAQFKKRAVLFALASILLALSINANWLLVNLVDRASLSELVHGATVSEWVIGRASGWWEILGFIHPNRLYFSSLVWPKLYVASAGVVWLVALIGFKKKEDSYLWVLLAFLAIAVLILQNPGRLISFTVFDSMFVRVFREPAHLVGMMYVIVLVLAGRGIERLRRGSSPLIVAIAIILSVAMLTQGFWSGRIWQKFVNGNLRAYETIDLSKIKGNVLLLPAIGPFLGEGESDIARSVNFNPGNEWLFRHPALPTEGGALFYGGSTTAYRNLIVTLLSADDPTALSTMLTKGGIRTVILDKNKVSAYPQVSMLGRYPSKLKVLDYSESTLLKAGFTLADENSTLKIYTLQNENDYWRVASQVIEGRGEWFSLSDKIASSQDVASDYINRSATYFDADKGFVRGGYWFWYDPTLAWAGNNFLFTTKVGAKERVVCEVAACELFVWSGPEGGRISVGGQVYNTFSTEPQWYKIDWRPPEKEVFEVVSEEGANAFSLVGASTEKLINNKLTITSQKPSELSIRGSGYVFFASPPSAGYYLKSNKGIIVRPKLANGFQSAFWLEEPEGETWKLIDPNQKTYSTGLVLGASGLLLYFLLAAYLAAKDRLKLR